MAGSITYLVHTVAISEIKLEEMSAFDHQFQCTVDRGPGHILILTAQEKEQVLRLKLVFFLKDGPSNLFPLRRQPQAFLINIIEK